MKYKYVMLGGYAFSENSDLKKLKKLAKQGWILEGVSMPLLSYRLRKDKPQNLDYALDYQSNYDEEYFSIFKHAGWTHVITIDNYIHIFSASEGTKPIYSDSTTQIEEYSFISKGLGKGALISFSTMVLLYLLIQAFGFKGWKFTVLSVFLVVAMIAFIFTFLPYLGYNYRIKRMKKDSV